MELNKENLYNEYIINNKSRKDCASIFNCSESLIIKRLNIYQIKKDRKEALKNQKATMIKKYGVDNAAYLASNYFKNISEDESKIMHKKAATTLVKNGSKERMEKTRKTCMKKYGAKTYAESDSFKHDMLSKNPSYAIINNKDKLQEAILNLDNPTYGNLCNFLGYSYAPVFNAVKEFHLDNLIKKEYSKTNVYWHDLIFKTTGVDFKYEGGIFDNPYEHVDLYLDSKKIAIDINPTITHNTQFNPFNPNNISSIDTKYHFRRAIEAEKNGWLLYQIFDWDDEHKVLEQLKNLLGLNEKIYARKCIIKRVSVQEKKDFLGKYHLQGNINSKYNYGLFYNDILVSVMVFGRTRFTKIADFELLRFCSIGNIIGGASKLFSYFIKDVNPNSIMTYSDMSKGHGNVYEKLGFKFYKYASLNALYAPLNVKGVSLKTQAASKEYNKHKEKFSSCKEYFNSKKWYRINDAGNKIWLWVKD